MMKKIFLVFLVFFGINFSVLAGMDINTASQADLESVKGLGPVKAKAIIEYRDQHGAFKSVEDLANVKGIGPGTLKQLGDQVSVQDEAAPGEAKLP
ncbi:helix-hairpin-helix domain-containing protein [Nitrosomonas sp.]|uniref:ComEA family DNA-binding protein n=1 Tax=Nitrosomonas sp. TaxID=42353 RepID=UPI003446E891